jgi:hypothetical protein
MKFEKVPSKHAEHSPKELMRARQKLIRKLIMRIS